MAQEDARAAISAACRKALFEGKRVAVIFGADWCPDCHAFQRALGHRLVAPLVELGYLLVHVSVGNRDKNLDLMKDYGMAVGNGIPSVAVLDPDGSLVVAQRDGEFRNSSSILSVHEIASFFERWSPVHSHSA